MSVSPAKAPPEDEIEITPAMMGAGIHAIMEFFAAEWGGRKGISRAEATSVLVTALNSMGLRHPNAETKDRPIWSSSDKNRESLRPGTPGGQVSDVNAT